MFVTNGVDVSTLMYFVAAIVCGVIGFFLRDFVKKVDGKVDKSVCKAIQEREDAVLDGLKKDIDRLTKEFGTKSIMVVDAVNALLEQQKPKTRKRKSGGV